MGGALTSPNAKGIGVHLFLDASPGLAIFQWSCLTHAMAVFGALAGAISYLLGLGLEPAKNCFAVVIDRQVDGQSSLADVIDRSVTQPKRRKIIPISLAACVIQKRCDRLCHVGSLSLPTLHFSSLPERHYRARTGGI